ncbi:hypothetical protein ACFLU6_03790 [Acidobacteriota bacterium]
MPFTVAILETEQPPLYQQFAQQAALRRAERTGSASRLLTVS